MVFALTLGLPVLAGPVIRDILIEVNVQDNGDAIITEQRTMDIDSEGTEGYIVIGNLAGSQLTNFRVTDETGTEYLVEPTWNVKRSRAAKTERCGILEKSDGGYELCWGLGNSGLRIYYIQYTITSLLRSYSDADGFNWMFVARDISPTPQHVKVKISFPFDEKTTTEQTLAAWGFGFDGDVDVFTDEVVAETDGPLRPGGSVIVMTAVKKGLLHPSMNETGTFEQVKNEAFEGSDYGEEAKPKGFVEKAKDIGANLLIGLTFVAPIALLIVVGVRNRRERKKVMKDLNWYRDIPMDGNLVNAGGVLSTYSIKGYSFDNLVSAMVLRLLRTKTLRIEDHFIEASRLKKVFGGEGKVQPCIVIGDYDTSNKLLASSSLRTLYDMFKKAAGDDNILQPNELKKWMSRNYLEVRSFVNAAQKKFTYKQCGNMLEDVRQVLGLKKFLEEFTLANERHLAELSLWNDYLVYAELFGIAEQVRKDMEKINPEFLRMDEVCQAITNKTVLPAFTAAVLSGPHAVNSSRSSGGGGRSSFGGGGGFHGGGSGGGVR